MDTNEFKFDAKMYSLMNSIEFANWLQDEMNKRGWNNSELARNAGVTRGAIGNVLRGDRRVGSELCQSIAKALNIPPEEVFRHAGLLPPTSSEEDYEKEAMYLLAQLSPQEREEILELLRFKAERKQSNKKSTSRRGFPARSALKEQ